MLLSVVATLFRTAPQLPEFVRRVTTAAQAVTDDFEIVLVNDGSPDDALDLAVALSREDKRITVVDLSRNFGHHKAIMTGLGIARGDLVFLIDSDLDEPPEILGEFLQTLREQKCDVVYGYQERRERGLVDRATGEIYYWLVNKTSSIPIPRNLITARLMTRRYVRSLLRYREQEVFIAGLWAATGYRQIGMPVEKIRVTPTSYSFLRRFSLLFTSLLSFSSRPLVFAALVGGTISVVSMLFIISIVIQRLSRHIVEGWATVVASIWFMGGLTIFFVGLVGLYVSKIFVEVKQRPYTIVRDIYRSGERTALEDG